MNFSSFSSSVSPTRAHAHAHTSGAVPGQGPQLWLRPLRPIPSTARCDRPPVLIIIMSTMIMITIMIMIPCFKFSDRYRTQLGATALLFRLSGSDLRAKSCGFGPRMRPPSGARGLEWLAGLSAAPRDAVRQHGGSACRALPPRLARRGIETAGGSLCPAPLRTADSPHRPPAPSSLRLHVHAARAHTTRQAPTRRPPPPPPPPRTRPTPAGKACAAGPGRQTTGAATPARPPPWPRPPPPQQQQQQQHEPGPRAAPDFLFRPIARLLSPEGREGQLGGIRSGRVHPAPESRPTAR